MTDILFMEKNAASIEKVKRLEPLMHPYRKARDTWDYVSASALIYEAFTRYGIPLTAYKELPSGRPYIASSRNSAVALGKTQTDFLYDGNADLSVSHSGRYTAVAITTAPDVSIGIDIEERERASKRDVIGLSKRFFSEEEAEQVLSSEDQTDTFLRLWTMKEALMKSRRIPLSQVLKGGITDSKVYFTTDKYVMCLVRESIIRQL